MGYYAYRSVMALHVVAVISWMAGILYLYRLFINHRERAGNSRDIHELLAGMEYRLYRYITLPAMIVALVCGITMIAVNPSLLAMGWLHIKLAAVVLLIASTVYAGHLVGRFAAMTPGLPSGKALRVLNEIPTLLMIIIVAMVIIRPF